MKIKKASTKRLGNKLVQLIHDGKEDHRIFHITNEIRRRVKNGR